MKKQSGFTLVEVILALAIAAAVLLAGVRFYSQYVDTTNGWRVNQNVEELFQALSMYYHGNCRGGTLDPANNPASPYAVPITTLASSGFLTSSWQALNPIVDATGPGGGYVVQLNKPLSTPSHMNAAACNNVPGTTFSGCTAFTSQTVLANSSVYVWVSQVAVKLKDATQASRYLLQLGANCISTYSGGTVTPCYSNPVAGGYLVWQLPETYISTNTASSAWILRPMTQQLVMQYTTDGMGTLSGAYSTGSVNGVSTNDSRNYLCGE